MGMVNSAFPINPVYRKSLPYDTLKDLAGVTQLVTIQIVLVANRGVPFDTVAGLVAYAKRNPGKLSFATPGTGATSHLAGELLKRAAGIEMVHVPYRGSAPAQTDLIGGRVDLMFDPFYSALPFVKAGKLKVIALNGDRRVAGYEQYPIVAETYPGFNVTAMLGLVVPAATPRPIVDKIQADVARVLHAPPERKRIEELGMEIVASTPEEFTAFVRSEMQKWGKVIREAGIEQE
jgi:tripartite-type tricarboxylate transporter receptor subunit TctC